jgi:hypothetical protein
VSDDHLRSEPLPELIFGGADIRIVLPVGRLESRLRRAWPSSSSPSGDGASVSRTERRTGYLVGDICRAAVSAMIAFA